MKTQTTVNFALKNMKVGISSLVISSTVFPSTAFSGAVDSSALPSKSFIMIQSKAPSTFLAKVSPLPDDRQKVMEPGQLSHATDPNELPLNSLYRKGDGVKYNIQVKGSGAIQLSIYVSESKENKVGFEFFMSADGGLGGSTELWQQFFLERGGSSKKEALRLSQGYIYSLQFKAPEIMPMDLILKKEEGGLQMTDFLITSMGVAGHTDLGEEQIKIADRTISARHFRFKPGQNGSQREMDYWINPSVRPIALVKMVSKGEKVEQNYELTFVSKLKGVLNKIDPSKAVPLTDQGRSLLGLGGK